MIQTVTDLVRRPLSEYSILDLGCAHGHYALEFARRGAQTLGIEGRASWVAHAKAEKAARNLRRVDFVQDDVRNLSPEKYGCFDVVLCLGLLYHLGAEDALKLLATVYDTCNEFAVIDTQIALSADHQFALGGKKYRGWLCREHREGATREEKEASIGSSLDDGFSFWFSRLSLLNALRHVGFTSVLECQNPVDNMIVNGEIKLHADYITMVAMKGKPVGSFIGAPVEMSPEIDWPEDPKPFYLDFGRPWTERDSALNERDRVLAARDAALVDRDAALAARDAALVDRDAALAARDAALVDRDAALAARDAALVDRDGALAARDAAMKFREHSENLTVENNYKDEIIHSIRGSITWKIASPLWRLETRRQRKVRRASK
jgi:SAM-dependent methyltransferase